ncbi:hypothetical protein A0H81_01654 [Grifola frondosa]|uniref:Uncharacterized protein n=1 Tax=Grifola frondosa TaxID=5627 RepID=A0A1C7MMC3_GRIFR|nr:hypothetical protein A0H81_01654 [Grifola frondosa]
MRNTLPLLSRAPAPNFSLPRPPSPKSSSNPTLVPTIRLISATPSATGSASDASMSFANGSLAPVAPFASSPLAPRAEAEPTRKRLVPKKSKLGLLGGNGKMKGKASKDFSDVVRRVGGSPSTGRGGFEIYVDHSEDPDLGEIVVVKKKKSRMGLDGMKWGALGEVTNVPSAPKEHRPTPVEFLKVKGDENQKWWSIGRGRKDSKEKAKEKGRDKSQARSKTPEPFKPLDSRARFNSLDSGILLSAPADRVNNKGTVSSVQNLLTVPRLASDPITSAEPPSIDSNRLAPNPPAAGSIAVRAIRSMRSLARMASWNQLSHPDKEDGAAPPIETTVKMKKEKSKEKAKGEGKKKKKKEKRRPRRKETTRRRRRKRCGTRGAALKLEHLTLGKKKQSILGLGLPSTMRFATTVRNATSSSTASANLPAAAHRLSVDSAHITMNANGRPSSILSNGSSLRPPSTASCVSAFSGRSPRSSSSSIASLQRPASLSPPASVHEQPIVMIEEATVDGHSDPRDEDRAARVSGSGETPVKRARPRPMSEQMLGRTRPRAICEDEDGVLSILDAVTNDLASLINRLDLEATPANSPANTSPLKLSSFSQGDESPIKKRVFAKDTPLKVELRESMASISSLRPYVHAQAIRQQAQKTAHLVGQQIVPWDSLSWQISPKKPTTTSSTAHLSHKRTMTPLPATEPITVFHPLRPAKSRIAPVTSASPASSVMTLSGNKGGVGTPSSRTFGSKTSLRSSQALEPSSCPSPVFSRIGGHVRKSSSLIPISDNESRRKSDQSMPLSREAKQGLGLCGTLGRSTEPPVDTEDPDSDIPNELQDILTSQADDDTLSYKPLQNPPSPGSPPALPLPLPEETNKSLVLPDIPVFQLFDEEANQADIDEGGNASSEDDTKKSFDFTGELKKLNESGASDRRSFVEQLENAFRTPAKIGLGFGLSDRLGFNGEFLVVPPVPPLPVSLRQPPAEDVAPRSVSILSDGPSFFNASASPAYNDSGVSEEPSFIMDFNVEDECRVYTELKNCVSVGSKPSDGQLNIDFKFGGKSAVSEAVEVSKKPLTLSDIIPPLSHSRSSSQSFAVEEDSSVLKSILAKAVDMPPPAPRSRLDSDSSSKRYAREAMRAEQSAMSPSRPASGVSFLGFDSFDEVRRGFEFGPNRPAFYPPPAARPSHTREVSLFSIASISSYGAVLDSGSVDPFGYDWSRPSSEDMSMSMSTSVDDTFAFMHKDGGRQRVDSDASSFYFRSPGASHTMHPYRRGHQRHSPAVSVASNAPPVSLYNRSFAGHRRNDSGTTAVLQRIHTRCTVLAADVQRGLSIVTTTPWIP